MPFCKKCGTEIESDAQFCVSCGTPSGITSGGSKPDNPISEDDAFKTVVRQKPGYGVVNLENLPKGHIIDGRYEVIEKLGQGGFGAVYRAFDKKMEIDKALKVLPEAVVSDLEAMDNLKAEATTMVRLNHPNIVRVYDFQDKGEIKYIDMEFVDGKSLTEVKIETEGKKLSEKVVKNIGKKIAGGLAYAHSQNVIHRDIKPQNILVSKSGDVKIMDFGISETVKSSMSRIANSGSSGTLVYMSPEQIRGKDVGKEADVYSYAAMLYELLSGKPPFHKGAIEHQILNEIPQPIEGISKEMNTFLLKCLEKEYTDRFRNFDEILYALEGKQPTKSSKKNVMTVPDPASDRQNKNGTSLPVQDLSARLGGFGKKAIFGGIGAIAVIILLVVVFTGGNGSKKTVTDVALAETAGSVVESKAGYNAKIKNLDKQIRSMQSRLSNGNKKSGDSLESIKRLIDSKKETEEKLLVLIKKEKAEADRLKREADEKFVKQLKKDIETYKDVISSEYGKTMKETAWKTLTDKYPNRSKGVAVGDTVTLLYGFAELRVETNAKSPMISILNIREPFYQGLKLKGGQYKLKVEAVGFFGKEVDVTLKPGQKKTAVVELIQYGRLYVSTKPQNARIRVLNIKNKYLNGMQLLPGKYQVEISAKGYVPQYKTVFVEGGGSSKVRIVLEKGISNSIGMKFVYIKPGRFEMGSNDYTDEKPLHRVTLTKGFCMQTTEVTQAQWKSVMGNNPSNFQDCGGNCPVEKVSWGDAKEFIRKLNLKERTTKYRLPTEAEWEYACRAGSKTEYADGVGLDSSGWYLGNSGSKTHPVGQKKANSWGLYDMHGNVYEWCEDWKGDYDSGRKTDPKGPETGSIRVTRGGSWLYSAEYCRVSARGGNYYPGSRSSNLGFRIAFTSGQ